MKRFISRYERVRRLRAQQEDVCRAAAAACNAARALAEERRNEVRQWLDTIHQNAACDLAKGMSGGVLVSMTSMMEHGQQRLHDAGEALSTADENLRQALLQHSQARAELRIIEEVIHREQTAHRREQLKHEEIQIQEQASQAYHRMQDMRSEQ
jgi:flagellar biosynthesis chaperone FliJ